MSSVTIKSLVPLFFSPLVTCEIAGAAELNHLLLQEIAGIRAALPGVNVSNQNGWHSNLDFFQRSEPGCAALSRHIIHAVGQATVAIAPDFNLAAAGLQFEGWINVNGRGAYNTPHEHPQWAWSDTYYVKVPPNPPGRSGCIEFLDSRTNVQAITVDGANCFASKYTHRPESGTLLIFPSYLRHWVYPNEQDEERVSVAFNARFIRKKS